MASSTSAKWHKSHYAENPVYFYSNKKTFYEFSNFYLEAPFELDGYKWLTTEHYFQAQKFEKDSEHYLAVKDCETPGDAFRYVRKNEVQIYRRKDWSDVSVAIMEKCLYAKFTQSEKLKKLLLSTGDKTLVEDSPRDSFWGCGKDQNGVNQLGLCLMNIRQQIKQEEQQ